MTTKSRRGGAGRSTRQRASAPSLALRSAAPQAVQVLRLARPPTFQKPKRIHPRRVLPLVREGVEREFHSASERAILFRRGVAKPEAVASDDVTLIMNTALSEAAAQRTASNCSRRSK